MNADLRPTPPQLVWVPLHRIIANTYQVRRTEDPAHVRSLAASIASLKAALPETLGLQQPPTARLVFADGTPAAPAAYSTPNLDLAEWDLYAELHFGHSRWHAFQLLLEGAESNPDDPESIAVAADPDYAALPLYLRPADNQTMWKAAVTENGIRRNLSALEEAIAVQRAIDELGLSQAEAGAALGLTPSATGTKLRLLKLPDHIKAALLDRTLSESVARALLPLLDAPHVIATFSLEDLAAATPGIVQKTIAGWLKTRPPLPLGDGIPYRTNWDTERTYNQPFDYDWAPPAHVAGALGPCTGCDFFVTFPGEAGARCTQSTENHRDGACYTAKQHAWATKEREDQIAAAAATQRAAAEAAQAAAAITEGAATAQPAGDPLPPAQPAPNGDTPQPAPAGPRLPRIVAELAPNAPLAAGDLLAVAMQPGAPPAHIVVTAILAAGDARNEFPGAAVVVADADESGDYDATEQTVVPFAEFQKVVNHTFTLPADLAAAAQANGNGAAAKQAAAAAQAAGAAAPAGAVTPREMVFRSKKLQVLETVEYNANWFGEYSAPAALVDHGLCSPDRCECMALAFNQYARQNHLRPDPQGAPNICLVCTSANRLANRRREMEHGDLKAYRAAVRANRDHAATLLKEAWMQIDPEKLFTHPVFLRHVLDLDHTVHGALMRCAPSDLPFCIYLAVADAQGKKESSMTVDGQKRHWCIDRLKEWIAAVSAEPEPDLRPEGWEPEDEKALNALYAQTYLDEDKCDRPRVLRYLAPFQKHEHQRESMLRRAHRLEHPEEFAPSTRPNLNVAVPVRAATEQAEEEEPAEEEPEEVTLQMLYLEDEIDGADEVWVVKAITRGATPAEDTITLRPWVDPDEKPDPDEEPYDPADDEMTWTHAEAAEYGFAFVHEVQAQPDPSTPANPEAADGEEAEPEPAAQPAPLPA